MNSFSKLARTIFFVDLFFLNLALAISHFIIFHSFILNSSSQLFIILVNLGWIFISFFNKNHSIIKRLNLNEILDKFIMTVIYLTIVVLSVIYFWKVSNVSRGFVLIAFTVFCLLVFGYRLITYLILQQKAFDWTRRKNIVVMGNREIADSLIENIENNPGYCYSLIGFMPDDQIHQNIGNEDLLKPILDKKADEVYVCYKEMELGLLDKLIQFGKKNQIQINVVFDKILNSNESIFKYNNYPILRINSQPNTSVKINLLKRAFDIIFSVLIMLLGSPIFFLLFIITKFTSKGPVFYKQERIGRNEIPFYIYKFRSMYIDSELSGPQLSKSNDPRITKWGMIMRKTRLDELPQFWNVLKGEMSIVGYRPERQHFIEEISKKVPDYKSLLRHKPGLTSLGQVHYGYAENIEQMCERSRFDLLYIRHLNLPFDLSIIFKTVGVMVQAKGK